MSILLVFAIIFITLALVFYTVGVWGEKISGTLSFWNLTCFWIGLIFDTTGTTLMSFIDGGKLSLNFHAVIGTTAIVLMIFHAIWATLVFFKGNETKKASFHRLSLFVWLIWLIPYGTGMFLHLI